MIFFEEGNKLIMKTAKTNNPVKSDNFPLNQLWNSFFK